MNPYQQLAEKEKRTAARQQATTRKMEKVKMRRWETLTQDSWVMGLEELHSIVKRQMAMATFKAGCKEAGDGRAGWNMDPPGNFWGEKSSEEVQDHQ